MHAESFTLRRTHCPLYESVFNWTVYWVDLTFTQKETSARPSRVFSVLCCVRSFALEREMLSKHGDGMLGFAQIVRNWLLARGVENRGIYECIFLPTFILICYRCLKPTFQIWANLMSEDQNGCIQTEYLWLSRLLPVMHHSIHFGPRKINMSNNKDAFKSIILAKLLDGSFAEACTWIWKLFQGMMDHPVSRLIMPEIKNNQNKLFNSGL